METPRNLHHGGHQSTKSRKTSEVGGRVQPGNRFVSCRARVCACLRACVRARARSGCLAEFEPKSGDLPIPFSLMLCDLFPFHLCRFDLYVFPGVKRVKKYKEYKVYEVYKVYRSK